MGSPISQTALEQLTLTVFVSSAVAAFSFSYETPAWLLLLPGISVPFWRIKRVPVALLFWARYLAWAFLTGVVILALTSKAYFLFSPQAIRQVSLIVGYGLAFFSMIFLLGRHVWQTAWTLLPVTLGVLVVACLNSSVPLATIATAAGAIFAYLLVGRETTERSRREDWKSWRQATRLTFSGLGVFLIAWAISQFLPWTHRHVENAIVGLISPHPSDYPGLSPQSRLGGLEQLKLSTKVVMRVWTDQPQKLRGRVFTRFDGETWHSLSPTSISLLPASPNLNPGNDAVEWLNTIPGNLFLIAGQDPNHPSLNSVRTKIVQTVKNGMLVSPGQKLLMRASVPQLRIDSFECLSLPVFFPIQIYGFVNRQSGDVVQSDAIAGEIQEQCLALSEDTDPRWRELAQHLASVDEPTEQIVDRTVRSVQNACRYSLEVGKFHSRQPVTEFFFEKKQGYCQYFASAAAILLRLQRIPCRYVTGFNVQEWNYQGRHFVVREADAHAWIEAYVPGKGWIVADPTPEAEFQARRESNGEGWLAQTTEWLMAEVSEISIRLREGDWNATIPWLLGKVKSIGRSLSFENPGRSLPLLVVILLALIALRRRSSAALRRHTFEPVRKKFDQVPPQLTKMMLNLDGLWARQGFARPASRTPLEHLESLPSEKISPALRDTSRKVVECYYRACFGWTPVEPAEVQELYDAISPINGRS